MTLAPAASVHTAFSHIGHRLPGMCEKAGPAGTWGDLPAAGPRLYGGSICSSASKQGAEAVAGDEDQAVCPHHALPVPGAVHDVGVRVLAAEQVEPPQQGPIQGLPRPAGGGG